MKKTLMLLLAAMMAPQVLMAGEDPIELRDEIMEETREALKPLGAMAKGEKEFDAEIVKASFKTWKYTAETFGDLFPKGTETGGGTEAKSTIWSDRAGFDRALADFNEAVEAAIAAAPASVEELKPVLGAVTKTCKGCHDGYRVKDD